MVGHYQVERILGMGGQAVVYLGRHVRLQSRLVAIKIPHGTETYRMLREADVMARLDHPGVVKIIDLDAEATPPYLVIEYCVGGSLADRIEAEGPLSEGEVFRITRELLEALRFAHLREVIHRDLKPENVLFDASGQPQIADFGLGKIVAEQISLSLSQASRTGVAGTPLYMAPEQERPGAPVDARADLYALGKLIYAMLTGESPRTLRPVEHLRPGLEFPWSDLVFALTETFPDARPADPDAVLTLLDGWTRPSQSGVAPNSTLGALVEASPKRQTVTSHTEAVETVEAVKAESTELRTPSEQWNERFQTLFDRVFGNLGYALALLFAVGGLFALMVGSEAGTVALVFSALIAFFASISAGETERLKSSEVAVALAHERALDARAEERKLLKTPARSAGALFAGVLAGTTGMVCFFTAMGGTIALVVGEEGGIVALIVSGFFFIATLIFLGIRRHLQRRAAYQGQAKTRIGPIAVPIDSTPSEAYTDVGQEPAAKDDPLPLA
ncbi:MAG: serine/threonine protein kinase [Planctomycetes bacterium]|nr:serine/threonine protein kinase [Planctomycetota bacterium]